MSSPNRALPLVVAAALLAGPMPISAATERVPSVEDILVSNDTKALSDWAYRYEHAVGVEQDTARAMRLYCKAAKLGDSDAAFQLGQIYSFGRSIERDQVLAIAWFHEAARDKNPKALGMLKLLKAEGQADEVDIRAFHQGLLWGWTCR